MDLNKETMLAQGYKKFDFDIAIGGLEEIPQLDPDLMYIKFILCHEGENANGDTFTKDVLKQAQNTPKYKPVDWEHGQPMIGHILDSMYKEDNSGIGYIEATGIVWKFMYPELSGQIKAKASSGQLKLSMECYYRDANYMIGDQLFDQQQAERMGIIPYVGREFMGKKVARVFKEVIFGGVGVVANPADKNAVFLAVARDLGLDKEEADLSQQHRDKLSDDDFAVPSKRKLPINDAEHVKLAWDMVDKTDGLTDEERKEAKKRILKKAKELGIDTSNWEKSDAGIHPVHHFNNHEHGTDSKNAIAVARFVKAFDKAKSSVVAKFNTKTLRSKEQVVAEVRNSVQTLLSEVASISSSYYIGFASEDSVVETEDEGLELYELMQNAFDRQIAYYGESAEAYIKNVQEDYVIYDIIDYSDDSVKTLKASFSNNDGEIQVDFANAVQFAEKEEIIAMEELNQEVATTDQELNEMLSENLDVNNPVAKDKKDGDPEDEKDGGDDEDTEDKNGKPKKGKASEYEAEIASLKDALAEKEAAYASLEERFSALEATINQIEAERLVASRLADLQVSGITFSGDRLAKESAKIKTMTEEAYADYKELLVEVAGVKASALEEDNRDALYTEAEEDDMEDAEASAEEIEVETSKAAEISLNVETPPPSNRKPFGHLSR